MTQQPNFGIQNSNKEDKEASVGKVLAATMARLPERLQHLWHDLSAYEGTFGLAAAQAMQPDATQADLWELANRSLLQELPHHQGEYPLWLG